MCLVLLLQCLMSCSLVCRPVGFKILLQNSVPLFEQSYVSLMALCRGVSLVCFADFVCMRARPRGPSHVSADTFIKRAHQEITASIQSPSENNSDHLEPTRKASRGCEEITMTIQGPPGNNSNHPEPIRGNGNASRAHQVPFTTPLLVDYLLGKLFKYLTRCGRGASACKGEVCR